MYQIITFLLIISVIFASYSIFIVWKHRHNAGSGELIIMLVMNIIWSTSSYFELSTYTINEKYFWTKMEYLGSSMMCTIWFIFIMKYLSLRIQFLQNRKWILLIIPFITLILVWTNEYHLLIHAKMHLISTHGLRILAIDSYGPVFYIFLTYSWIMMIAAIFICFFSATLNRSVSKKQQQILAYTVLIPLAFNVLYFTRMGEIKYFDLTPVSFSFMGLLLSYALTKYKLVDLSPVAIHTIFEHIMDGIIVLNGKHKVMEINPAGKKILRINNDIIYDGDIYTLIPDLPKFNENDDNKMGYSLIIGDSWYEINISKMHHDNILRGWVLTLRDITTKKDMEEKLHRLAFYDITTNLPNRMLFFNRLNSELMRIQRTNKKIAILFIDIDEFKTINDTMGHETGDIILRVTAEKLHHCMRETDMAARIGGDEFLIMLTDITEEHYVENCAKRILAEIAKPIMIADNSISTSVSIGIIVTSDNFTCADTLIRNADEAMYAAKENGKNQFSWYKTNSSTPQSITDNANNTLPAN